MDNHLYQIIIGSYGGLLLLVISLLLKILFEMSKKQDEQSKAIDFNSYVIKEIKGEAIPTIRIQIEKLEHKSEDLELRTDRIEQSLGRKLGN